MVQCITRTLLQHDTAQQVGCKFRWKPNMLMSQHTVASGAAVTAAQNTKCACRHGIQASLEPLLAPSMQSRSI